MGATHVTVTIRNPAEPDRTWEALFLVDTGATDCLVPNTGWEAIGLQPRGQLRAFADGSEITAGITTAAIEFMHQIVGDTITSANTDGEIAVSKLTLVHPNASEQPPTVPSAGRIATQPPFEGIYAIDGSDWPGTICYPSHSSSGAR